MTEKQFNLKKNVWFHYKSSIQYGLTRTVFHIDHYMHFFTHFFLLATICLIISLLKVFKIGSK